MCKVKTTKKTTKRVPIYPRITLANDAWLTKYAKKTKTSKSRVVEGFLEYFRNQYVQTARTSRNG